MNVRAALAAALAVPLAGCPSTWNCNPPSEAASVDAVLDAAALDAIVAGWGLESRADIPCDVACSEAYRTERGWEISSVTSCALAFDLPEDPDASNAANVVCEGTGIEYYCEGRRPLGHVELDARDADPLGRHCAELAYLEASSVPAFRQLAATLAAHGAPADLVGRCQAAAEDEVRHATWMTALAARHGAAVPAPQVADGPVDLASLALHNAVEGCVHETWGALVAAHKARAAQDPELRAIYARIAVDEAEHAQLAWDLHAWLLDQLDPSERAAVHHAQAGALARLPALAAAQATAPATALGQPEPSQAHALAEALVARLAA